MVRITETKEFEEKVRVHEKRYRDLFNHSQALICTHDMDGKLLTVNPATCKILGFEEQEMLGRNLVEFIPEKHRDKFDDEYLRPIRISNAAVSGGATSLKPAKGYLMFKNYRREEFGLEPYVIGFSQDITDRIKMEKELRFTKQLTDEIARAKESFLAHMSHDIRTPMNGILGIASLLNKTQLDSSNGTISSLSRSANRLLVIVNDILDLEKIVAGKLQLETIPFKIVDKIATIISPFIYRAEEKELGLIFQNFIPAELVVKGDPYRLSQVLNHILSNALKYTETGHITIGTGIREHTEDDAIIEITISDTCIGIVKKRLSTIFEPFEQTMHDLPQVWRDRSWFVICKIWSGNAEWRSAGRQRGREKALHSPFTLPYQISIEERRTAKSDRRSTKSLGPRKVLVAEDVELNQFLARHILESWDFEVVIAGNGLEAIDRLGKEAFDCILMDVQMPEMDRIEATHHIEFIRPH